MGAIIAAVVRSPNEGAAISVSARLLRPASSEHASCRKILSSSSNRSPGSTLSGCGECRLHACGQLKPRFGGAFFRAAEDRALPSASLLGASASYFEVGDELEGDLTAGPLLLPGNPGTLAAS